MAERYLTVKDVAARYSVSPWTVYRWVFLKRIPHHKPGPKTLRFSEVELDLWDQRNAVGVGKFHSKRSA